MPTTLTTGISKGSEASSVGGAVLYTCSSIIVTEPTWLTAVGPCGAVARHPPAALSTDSRSSGCVPGRTCLLCFVSSVILCCFNLVIFFQLLAKLWSQFPLSSHQFMRMAVSTILVGEPKPCVPSFNLVLDLLGIQPSYFPSLVVKIS